MACQPTLAPAERLQYQQYLEEAMASYHGVMVGGQVREFHDQNGERIVYSSSNRTALLSYINWLRSMLGLGPLCGIVARPAGVFL